MSKDSRKQFFQRLKFLKIADVLSAFPMLFGFFCSLFLRLAKQNIWLICERKNEARDNGYWFFKYLCENHKEIQAVYAINKKSPDFRKVNSLGKVISFGTLSHWIYYFAAKRNISSQKEGKPNAALCFVLEVYLGFRKNRAYIRHGICKDDQRWVYYDVTKMSLFACSARREYNFVKDRFGYPDGAVKLLGMCRYDHLLMPHEVKRQIIVMPTMREWLRTESQDTLDYEKTLDVSQSEYFTSWNSFLQSKALSELLEANEIQMLFFPHASMQKYIGLFETECERITIASFKEYDVQALLMESSLLITDYSSVFFDFAYMRKPTIYYQFDYDKYRKGQYQEGYFSYQSDGFGPVVSDLESLLKATREACEKGFRIEKEYEKRVRTFFAFFDANNCYRTYNAIKEMR